jgi:hypothetical protein
MVAAGPRGAEHVVHLARHDRIDDDAAHHRLDRARRHDHAPPSSARRPFCHHAEAERVEATDPVRAAALRQRAARILG